MTLIALYDEAVARGDLKEDPRQRELLLPLETLSQALCASKGWFSWLTRKSLKGIYLYGPVGVGKTFLMDLFYENVTIPEKKRFHFHHFMQQIDAQLRRLQGQKNPLHRIASDIADSTRVLCFDEFMVDDVAYAMILADLLQALCDKGVILVATSNTAPDNLYLKGVQRARFLPAIAAIKSHCEIFDLGDKRDYRLGREPKINTYVIADRESASNQLRQQFDEFESARQLAGVLTIQHRDIAYIECAEHTVWFDFKVICNRPRSQLDYLELANRFDTIIVSNIPVLGENDTLFAILFIHFVDVMYDQGIRLILSADVPIDELYQKGEMLQVFKRTSSRLQEMQSTDYLKRHPRRALHNLLA